MNVKKIAPVHRFAARAEARAIMTDTDNTRATARAWYGEISPATEGK